MPTLNLLNSITPTGSWRTDSIAPYDMQPYDYRIIQTNIVLDALNPLIEITNIPVGAMIANPPNDTAPYNSSILTAEYANQYIFIKNESPLVTGIIPSQNEQLFILSARNIVNSYNNLTEELTVSYDIFHQSMISELEDYESPHEAIFDFNYEEIYYENDIILGSITFYDGGLIPGNFFPNEIQSSYSVISKDLANRKAIIRVNANIENLRPPLNRLFLSFDRTP